MRQRVLRALVVSLIAAVLVAPSGAPAAQDASPVATPAGPALGVERLVTTTFPAAAVPTASSPAFLVWYAIIAPGIEVAIPPELVACCPGPHIEHVLAGELAVRVEGPLRVLRASPGGGPAPAEQVAPGTVVVLRPGDTAVYGLELAATYRNAGWAPVHVAAGGIFAGSPPVPPAGYAILSVAERYPAPEPPPGPLTVTLQRATLAPEGIFPAPPTGSMQVVVTGPEPGALAELGDGSVENLGREAVVVYALVLDPTGPASGTPAVA